MQDAFADRFVDHFVGVLESFACFLHVGNFDGVGYFVADGTHCGFPGAVTDAIALCNFYSFDG